MNEAPDAEREPAGYIRLPWQVVVGGLFLFLAALFAYEPSRAGWTLK